MSGVRVVVVAEQAVDPAGSQPLLLEEGVDQRGRLVVVRGAEVVGPGAGSHLVRAVHQVAGQHQLRLGPRGAEVLHQLLKVPQVALKIGAHQQAAAGRQLEEAKHGLPCISAREDSEAQRLRAR